MHSLQKKVHHRVAIAVVNAVELMQSVKSLDS